MQIYGGHHAVIPKQIFNEQWDDFQLKAVGVGGNKAYFELIKAYNLDNVHIKGRHESMAVKWYRRKHLAAIDGRPFNEIQPRLPGNETEAEKKMDEVNKKVGDRVLPTMNKIADKAEVGFNKIANFFSKK